jgi:MoaA/NifB/PqqE/SkfB family radical SAM enzyme
MCRDGTGSGAPSFPTSEGTMNPSSQFGLRTGAEEFPLMVVISIIYPCNFGCPNCPYTDINSPIRKFYHEHKGDLLPVELWTRMADECGAHGAWMRCTGGGEPMLHPKMVEMIEYARSQGAHVWMNTNGSRFGPDEKGRKRLERLLRAGIDLIEFSMDAGDAETYAVVRPPIPGIIREPVRRFEEQVGNVRAALEMRKSLSPTSRVVVSIIRQQIIEDRLDEAIAFWTETIGVDEVITRKFLSWDDNTSIDLGKSLDKHLYAELPTERKEPCVWPFERLNVDTLGRIALCGQDISYRTADLFPTLWEKSIKEIWQGEMFSWYRRMHLEGRGAECWPCRGCSAWLAGVRDWQHGWLKVLKHSGENLVKLMRRDLGVEVEVYTPAAASQPAAPGRPEAA